MARQDSRHKSPEKDRDAECTYTSETGTVKMDRQNVTRMPEERLPKKILYGELEMGKRSHGGQEKRYKDTLKASFNDFNIPTESWHKLHKTEQSGEASLEEVPVNMRKKESAKPSRNVQSAKQELRHHKQSCLALTSVVPSVTDSLELELVLSAILEHTNSEGY